MALSVGHPRGTHSRCVIGCCLIPLEICGVKNNSRRITYGIGCMWGMPSLSLLWSLGSNRLQEWYADILVLYDFRLQVTLEWVYVNSFHKIIDRLLVKAYGKQ